MKKLVIGVILLAMFGWAIYSFTSDKKQEAESKQKAASSSQQEDVGLQQGQYAPDFKLKNMDGEEVKLSDFKGKKVLLNFWATWCPPCRSEIPDLEKFHQKSDVAVIGVDSLSQERNTTVVSEFIKEYDMTYPVLKDKDGLIISMYQVQSYPTSYLIDSKGRISNIAVGPLNEEQMIQAFEKME